MLVNNEVYNYLSNTTTTKKRTTAHNSSELRAVYNNMAKYNKSLPLYKFSLSPAKQERVINIKEAALTLKDVAASFNDKNSEVYSRKMLISDNEESVSGSVRGGDIGSLPDSLEIQVKSLASGQVNKSDFLPSTRRYFSAGSYKDLSRVAKLNEKMWAELFLENKENLLFEIDTLIKNLQEYSDALREENEQKLIEILADGTQKKERADKGAQSH